LGYYLFKEREKATCKSLWKSNSVKRHIRRVDCVEDDKSTEQVKKIEISDSRALDFHEIATCNLLLFLAFA